MRAEMTRKPTPKDNAKSRDYYEGGLTLPKAPTERNNPRRNALTTGKPHSSYNGKAPFKATPPKNNNRGR